MSYGQIGSFAGQIIGSYYGGSVGGAIGGAIGGYIGSTFDPAIYNRGPRISDLKIQNGAFGTPISVCLGTSRLAGTVGWVTDIREHENSQSVGKSGQKQYNVNYTYDLDCMVILVDEHGFPVRGITGVRRIWANGALVRTVAENASIGSLIASSQFCDQVTVYPGDYNQLPDPTMEAALGAGNVSAHRGFAYAVFKGIQVDGKGSPLPQFEFEVVQGGTVTVAKTVFGSDIISADNYGPRSDTWCGVDSAMIVRYTSDSSKIGTQYFQAGDVTPQSRVLLNPDTSSSGFHRTFANCATAPIMADINYGTATPTDGMTLRIWDMRPLSSTDDPDNVSGNGSILINKFIPVDSYPEYTLTGMNRVAYEEATTAYAFGGVNPAYYYGQRVFFQTADDAGFCVLPTGRVMIDIAIYLGTLYVWNFGGASPYQTYITAYDDSGAQLFDDAHTIEGFGNDGNAWARLLANQHGIFTWCTSVPTRVARYAPSGAVILCNDADSGGGDGAIGDNSTGVGFWTDGVYCNVGATPINDVGQTERIWTIQFQALTKGFVSLGYALSAICRMAGLTDDQVDATMQTQTLRGYSFKSVSSAVSFLQPLCTDFYTEGYESEGKIKFRTIGGPTVADIPFEDLGWSEDDTTVVEPFLLTRAQEKDLPRSYTVVYANWDADFQVGSEAPAKRLITTSVNDVQVETPITATADEAAKRQSVLLYKAWLERDRRSLALSRKYAFLEPTDPVTVEYPKGTVKRYRTQHGSYEGPVLTFDLVPDDPSLPVSTARGANVAQPQGEIPLATQATVALLDIPLLRDGDNSPGFYAAFSSRGSYNGAQLYEADNSGTVFNVVATSTTRTAIGTAMTVLDDWGGGNVWDMRSTVRVSVSGGTLSSGARDAITMSNLNTLLVGKEILQFAVATPVTGSPGFYDLSVFLRYQRGTEAATHTVGETVVLLQTSGMRTLPDALANIGRSQGFKVVSGNTTLSAATVMTFTNNEIRLKPFAPVDLRATIGAIPVVLSWHRRSRLSSRLFQAVPLGEATEAYEVDVIDPAGHVLTTIPTTTASASLTAFLPVKHLNNGLYSSMWQGQQYNNYVFGLSSLGSSMGGDQFLSLVSYDLTTGELASRFGIAKDTFTRPNSPAISFQIIGGGQVLFAVNGSLTLFNFADLIGVFFSTPGDPAAPSNVGAFAPSGGAVNGAFALATNGIWFAFNAGTDAKLANLATADLSVSSTTTMSNYPTFVMQYGRVACNSATSRLYAIVLRSDTGFGIEEYDVSSSTPTRTGGVQISGDYAQTGFADIAIFGSNVYVGMPDGIRIYDLATLTLQKIIASTVPSGSFEPYFGLDMFTLTLDGKLAFFDNVRAGFVFLNTDTTIASILPSASTADGYFPRLVASTSDGLVVFAPAGSENTTGPSLDVLASADFSTGYTARVYQLSATVGRGTGSKPVALG